MKIGQIKIAKETFPPLYSKGDKFKILDVTSDKDMLPILAKRLKNKKVYGFEYGELK